MIPRIPKPEKRKGDILAVQIRVPEELRQIVGQTVIRRSTGTKDDRIYYQRAPRYVLEIEAILQTAREQLAPPPRWVLVRPPITRRTIIMPTRFGCRQGVIERGRVGHMIVEVQAESPDPAYPATPASGPAMGRASEPVAPATTTPSPRSGQNLRGCTTEEVIQFWITDRATPPKNKAIKARRSKMAAFFAWAHKPDDVTQITAEDLQNYKQHLVRAHGNNHARDHLFDLCSLIRIAADNGKLRDAAGKVISKPNTPADAITLPAKRDGLPRPAFSDHEARTLLLAARDHVLPIVKWGTRLGAGLGLITSEFADANVRDVEMMDGIACLCIRTENRTTDVKGLKTGARVRYMPLPTTWRDEFLAYADGVRQMHGDKAPLFADIPADRDGQRNTKASAEIMRFIRGCGIENVTDPDTGTVIELRDSYSWRHRFASKLESIAIVKDPATGKEIANKSDRQRYLCGHAGKDVHGKVYLEHLPRETLHIIDAIRDPTANDPEYAEAAE